MTTITVTGPSFLDPLEELLEQITERVDSIVNRIVSDSHQLDRYEESITARVAGAITDSFRVEPVIVGNLTLEVVAEEFKRKDEKKVGADLYISVVRQEDGNATTKGMLVQAKRRSKHISAEDYRRLGAQAKRMYRKSDDSYVMIYEEHGVVCGDAPQSTMPKLKHLTNPQSLGELIASGLRCDLGDLNRGRDLSLPVNEGIKKVMHEIASPIALGFTVKHI